MAISQIWTDVYSHFSMFDKHVSFERIAKIKSINKTLQAQRRLFYMLTRFVSPAIEMMILNSATVHCNIYMLSVICTIHKWSAI